MAVKFEKLVLMQRWKMLYMLITYVLSSAVAIVTVRYLVPYVGVVVSIFLSILCALSVAWLLTRIVNHSVLSRCPVCHSTQLAENYNLQCRMPEYECSHCQRVYSGKQ